MRSLEAAALAPAGVHRAELGRNGAGRVTGTLTHGA